MYSGNPLTWTPTTCRSAGGKNPNIPTPYSLQYLSSSSLFHLSMFRYRWKFSNKMTEYRPLSKFVNAGNDFPVTSILYLRSIKMLFRIRILLTRWPKVVAVAAPRRVIITRGKKKIQQHCQLINKTILKTHIQTKWNRNIGWLVCDCSFWLNANRLLYLSYCGTFSTGFSPKNICPLIVIVYIMLTSWVQAIQTEYISEHSWTGYSRRWIVCYPTARSRLWRHSAVPDPHYPESSHHTHTHIYYRLLYVWVY